MLGALTQEKSLTDQALATRKTLPELKKQLEDLEKS